MLVSIIIPTYNRPAFLARLLSSIISQTFRDFEVIIINDCSGPETLNDYRLIIDSYTTKLPKLTYYINDTRRGAPYSRNRGILATQSELIALVDDDDEWLPTKLEKQVRLFSSADDTLGLIYTWVKVVDQTGQSSKIWKDSLSGDVRNNILRRCFIPSPSVMARKSALVKAGLFDEQLPSCQDWDMWTRIFLQGYTCQVIESVEAIYHKHKHDSVGLSNKALTGYLVYYKKHLSSAWKINKFTALIMLIKYLKISLILKSTDRRPPTKLPWLSQ